MKASDGSLRPVGQPEYIVKHEFAVMRWVRAHKSYGGWAALFALALQFVLSFGHIHREDIFGSGTTVVAASSTALGALPTAEDFKRPDRDQPSDPADDYCAICATMHLLGASFVAEAPQAALPIVSCAIEHRVPVAVAFIASQRTPFQSRAPPLV